MKNSMTAEFNRRNALRRRGVPNMARMVHPLVSKPPVGNMAHTWRIKILDRKRRLQRDARARIAQAEVEARLRSAGDVRVGDGHYVAGAAGGVAGEQVPEQGGGLLAGLVENATLEGTTVSPKGTEQTGELQKVGGDNA